MTQSSLILKFLFREPSTQWQLNASTCDHVHVIIWNKTCFSVFWTNCPDYAISFHGGIPIFNRIVQTNPSISEYYPFLWWNLSKTYNGNLSKKKPIHLQSWSVWLENSDQWNVTFAGVHCKKKFVRSYLKPNLHKLYIIGKVLNVLPNIIFSSLSLIANQPRHNDISMSELIRYQIWLH